jgi:hypothetical protein
LVAAEIRAAVEAERERCVWKMRERWLGNQGSMTVDALEAAMREET